MNDMMGEQGLEPEINGPIPGENYTSDTRNYPWHRPPDMVDYDEAVEYVMQQLSEPRTFSTAMTMLEAGASLTGVVSTINMINIGDGRYPIDLSILIAGPIARYLQVMAKQSGIKALVGNEDEDEYMTLPRLKALAGVMSEGEIETPVETMPVEAPQQPVEGFSGGLMGMPTGEGPDPATEGVQSAMLGYGVEEGMY
jgi:hypothetical protein